MNSQEKTIDSLKEFLNKVNNFNQLSSSEKIDFFLYYHVIIKGKNGVNAKEIRSNFEELRITPYSNISQYLDINSKKGKNKKIKFLKSKSGYHLESLYENELKSKINIEEEIAFVNYKIDANSQTWKPSDIPFTNNKIRKNAEFFSTLYYLFYHLENSLRKFILHRLSSIIGSDWEKELCANVDLAKAQSIRNEVSLVEMLPERGDNILYYCMWDDYAKIVKSYPQLFKVAKEADEILAHLNSMGKIRNAIAHNAATVPKEYQDELTIFLIKYIKILKANE